MLSNRVLSNFKKYVEAGGPRLFDVPGPRLSRLISPLGAYDSASSLKKHSTSVRISDFEAGGRWDFKQSYDGAIAETELDRGALARYDAKLAAASLKDFSEGGRFNFESSKSNDEEDDEESAQMYLDELRRMLRACMQTQTPEEFMAFVRNFCGAESGAGDGLPSYKSSGVPNNAVAAAMDDARAAMRHIRDVNGWPIVAPSRSTETVRGRSPTLATDAAARAKAIEIAPGLARITRV